MPGPHPRDTQFQGRKHTHTSTGYTTKRLEPDTRIHRQDVSSELGLVRDDLWRNAGTPHFTVLHRCSVFTNWRRDPPPAKTWPRALLRHSLYGSGLGLSLPQLRGVPGEGEMPSGWDETMEAMWQSGTLKTWEATTCFICFHSQCISITGKKSLNHKTKI